MSVAKVDEEKCIGCGLCADICIADSVAIKEWVSHVDEKNCRGCGLCIASCPTLAMDLKFLPRRLLLGRIEAMLRTTHLTDIFEPRIILFICDWISRKGADLGVLKRIKYSSNIRAIKVPCYGSIDPILVFEALRNGADGVLIVGCGEGDCNFLNSNMKATSRMKFIKEELESLGIESERFKSQLIPLAEAKLRFPTIIEGFINKVREIGQSPL